MDIFDVPFSWQIGMLIGLVALYVFFKGLELPKDYKEKQAARMILKRKVAEMELEQAQMKGVSSEIDKN
jgi:elongation factor P--beta-lysine ligase